MDNKKLEEAIQLAVKKISGKKENDICQYIPGTVGGYIHHFTMRKMKTENPQQLFQLVEKHILDPSAPKKVAPKARAARGSRKRKDFFTFSKNDLERMLNMARIAGDKEMVRKLTPKKDLKTIKRELLASIRQGRVEQDLWSLYVETVSSVNLQPQSLLSPALA